MSSLKSHTNVLVHPLVYDALSGEFLPKCDPAEKAHTLGRLMIASIQKGSSEVHETTERKKISYTYAPSWATSLGAVMNIFTYEAAKGIFTPESVHLATFQAGGGGNLSVTLKDNLEEPSLSVRAGGDVGNMYEHIPLVLNDRASETRDWIASLAGLLLSPEQT